MPVSRAVRLILTVLLGLWAWGCASVDLDRIERSESSALAKPEETRLGQMVAPSLAENPEKSGFRLLDRGLNSILWRGVLTDAAMHTIDAQYFIWRDDNIGILGAERLLRAANRGVRVRVLVDDFELLTDERYLALLDSHPNAEVRLYNPFGTRTSVRLVRMFSIFENFSRLNRRMHNKTFIVDNSLAIIGGRNIANEYFDMHASYNFRDRDLLAAGPIVPEISGSFDEYWNSKWAVPVHEITPIEISEEERATWYQGLHAYAEDPKYFPKRFHAELAVLRDKLPGVVGDLVWGEARLFYDHPGKNEDPDRFDAYGRSGELLTETALATERELLAQTPYFVMLPGTFEVVESLRQRQVDIRVLTNSLSSTDGIAPFACYARQRREILESGVDVYEMRPDAASQHLLMEKVIETEERPVWGLHAKTVVFDRRKVYIGTFNMDPRSTHLNTEIGVLIDSPALAEQVAEILEADMEPENAWHVTLDADGDPQWKSRRNGALLTASDDPDIDLLDEMKILLIPALFHCGLV